MKKKKVNVIITIIIEYALICLNKQGSEYARVLNIPDIVHSLWSLYKLFSILRHKLVQNFVRQLRWDVLEE